MALVSVSAAIKGRLSDGLPDWLLVLDIGATLFVVCYCTEGETAELAAVTESR